MKISNFSFRANFPSIHIFLLYFFFGILESNQISCINFCLKKTITFVIEVGRVSRGLVGGEWSCFEWLRDIKFFFFVHSRRKSKKQKEPRETIFIEWKFRKIIDIMVTWGRREEKTARNFGTFRYLSLGVYSISLWIVLDEREGEAFNATVFFSLRLTYSQSLSIFVCFNMKLVSVDFTCVPLLLELSSVTSKLLCLQLAVVLDFQIVLLSHFLIFRCCCLFV